MEIISKNLISILKAATKGRGPSSWSRVCVCELDKQRCILRARVCVRLSLHGGMCSSSSPLSSPPPPPDSSVAQFVSSSVVVDACCSH